MFKSKKKPAETTVAAVTPSQPAVRPEQVEAERVIARGERIKRLSAEAAMWRNFAGGCKPGRIIMENISLYPYAEPAPRLDCRFDEDSALLWAAFANQMAEERERRLRESLGV